MFECLSVCGLCDGIEKFGYFCIDMWFVVVLCGDVVNGLFFCGWEVLLFGCVICSVCDLFDLLLMGSVIEFVVNCFMFMLV